MTPEPLKNKKLCWQIGIYPMCHYVKGMPILFPEEAVKSAAEWLKQELRKPCELREIDFGFIWDLIDKAFEDVTK